MSRKILFTFIAFLSFLAAFAQDKKDIKKNETKMEAFASRTGVIVKFVDYKLSGFKQFLGEKAETRIRKVIAGGESRYFYQIEKHGEYSNPTASIEYSDLLEVIKAFEVLKNESATDISSKPDYLENKFTTSDGFQIGYYIDGSKIKWYMQLESYGSGNTIFINDADAISGGLQEAKSKIEELKK